jgi:uncharacterized protein (DUF488 family)
MEPEAREPVAYSVGHSSLPIDAFLGSLKRFGVVLVVDVRRYPGSRRHPQFNRRALEVALARESIGYLHLGEALGGYRDVPYEEHVETDRFREGLAILRERIAAGVALAFLCAEKNPWQCHRRFIARELEKSGVVVRHIVDGQILLGSA